MPSAIVTGATGILGLGIVRELSKDAAKWKTIHALSRSQTEEHPANVKNCRVDLKADPEVLARQLDGIEGEYLFFTAYIEGKTEQEQCDLNGALLSNFLQALRITGAEKKLKRVILPNGGKYYGLHLGPAKQPAEEDDPRVDGTGRPPNFYYLQQDILKEFSQDKSWDWVVTCPNDVIGFARGNFMNLSTAIALYASVVKELGEDFIFPGSVEAYRSFVCYTDSKLYGRFSEWLALTPECGDQIFNAVNGDVQCWQTLWPKVAKRFGLSVPPDQFSRAPPLPSRVDLPAEIRPPMDDYAKVAGLVGYVQRGSIACRVDLVQWASRPEVRKAWQSLATREGLANDAFDKATWGFAAFLLGANLDQVLRMSKARKLGWTGYCDTWDSFGATFDELEKERIIPKYEE